MSIFIGDSDISNIYIGEGKDSYSAMQGPCPDGFHIPLDTEWNDVINMGVSLGAWTASNGNDMVLALKMPKSKYLKNNTGTPFTSTSYTYYHSLKNSSSVCFPLYMYNGGNIGTSSTASKSEGYHIRPFKDEPVTPDSSWTEIFIMPGTPQGMYVGIYHNPSLGIISISDNTGGNWITIADKNLGATVVYNNGDTLGQNNCGNYYQYGNNYGFPFSGAVNTSSTKVDTTGYGPGNYYFSDTFITVSSGNWEITNSQDLWGYVTGMTKGPNVKEVYKGTTKIRPISR